MKLFKDILREKNEVGGYKYSQGRVYLFISFISFIGVLVYMAIKSYKCIAAGEDVNTQSEELIINALQWCLGTFALYVLGGKGINIISNKVNKEKLPATPPVPQEKPVAPPSGNNPASLPPEDAQIL